MYYYAYIVIDKKSYKPIKEGIVNTWSKCNKQVRKRFARYKKFETREEAQSYIYRKLKWLEYCREDLKKGKNKFKHKSINLRVAKELKKAENKVINKNYERIVNQEVKKEVGIKPLSSRIEKGLFYYYDEFSRRINLTDETGKVFLLTDPLDAKEKNNHNQLYAFEFALEYAMKHRYKNLVGSTTLILEFWTAEKYEENRLHVDTVKLIKQVIEKRKEFEQSGGQLGYRYYRDSPAYYEE